MPEATDDVLLDLVDHGPFTAYRIEAPSETGDSHFLGLVGIEKRHPYFRSMAGFAFNGKLSPEARFEIRLLERAGHPTIVFIIFRQFDRSRFQSSPEDLVAGWVPAEERRQAEGWVTEMNDRIHERQRGSTHAHFAVWTRASGRIEPLVSDVQRALGTSFWFSTDKGFDGATAYEAEAMGMKIFLSELPPDGSYPRRFLLRGTPDRDFPDYDAEGDLGPEMIERLRATGAEWHLASREQPRDQGDQ